MVSGAEKKKRKAAAAAIAAAESATSSAIHDGASSASTATTSAPPSSPSSEPITLNELLSKRLPAPFRNYVNLIDGATLLALYRDVGSLQTQVNDFRYQMGYDKGWKLGHDCGHAEGLMEGQERADLVAKVRKSFADASVATVSPTHCSAAVDAAPKPCLVIPISVPSAVLDPILPSTVAAAVQAESSPTLDWSEDADLNLPLPPTLSPAPSPSFTPAPVLTPAAPLVVNTPRNLSALRSGSNSRPFSTLQRRMRRVHGPRIGGSQNPSVRVAPRRPSRPRCAQPTGPFGATPTGSDVIPWESDPRLIELGRVLTSLGWTRVTAVHDEDVAHVLGGSRLPYVT